MRLALAIALTTFLSSTAARADPPVRDGRHDFDARFGDWKVKHKKLAKRLVGSQTWVEFTGTYSLRPLLGGLGNVGDNLFDVPGAAYRGVSLRAYDPRTGQWAVWWLDGRNPLGEIDPPMIGRFDGGDGAFYADQMIDGRKVRVRAVWSRVTATSTHWEQAFSVDGGKTWEVNWISDFQRAN